MKKLLTVIAIIISLQAVGQNIKTVKDTVVIKSAVDINWIKINGELYQVKKWLSVEKYVVPTPNLQYPMDPLIWRGGGIINPGGAGYGIALDSTFIADTTNRWYRGFEAPKLTPARGIIYDPSLLTPIIKN